MTRSLVPTVWNCNFCLRQWHYYGCGLSAATTEYSSTSDSVSPSFLLSVGVSVGVLVCVCVLVC